VVRTHLAWVAMMGGTALAINAFAGGAWAAAGVGALLALLGAGWLVLVFHDAVAPWRFPLAVAIAGGGAAASALALAALDGPTQIAGAVLGSAMVVAGVVHAFLARGWVPPWRRRPLMGRALPPAAVQRRARLSQEVDAAPVELRPAPGGAGGDDDPPPRLSPFQDFGANILLVGVAATVASVVAFFDVVPIPWWSLAAAGVPLMLAGLFIMRPMLASRQARASWQRSVPVPITRRAFLQSLLLPAIVLLLTGAFFGVQFLVGKQLNGAWLILVALFAVGAALTAVGAYPRLAQARARAKDPRVPAFARPELWAVSALGGLLVAAAAVVPLWEGLSHGLLADPGLPGTVRSGHHEMLDLGKAEQEIAIEGNGPAFLLAGAATGTGTPLQVPQGANKAYVNTTEAEVAKVEVFIDAWREARLYNGGDGSWIVNEELSGATEMRVTLTTGPRMEGAQATVQVHFFQFRACTTTTYDDGSLPIVECMPA
jgi:hypothetical protein